MGTRKLAATAIFLTFVLTTTSAAQDVEDSVVEAAAAYLSAVHLLKAVKNTQCGYALLMDAEDLSRKAELDIINALPEKRKKELPAFISTLKQESQNVVAEHLKDIEGKLDDKTRCGLVVGMFIGNFTQYWTEWERAKKKL
jgi:hypothetical protein